MERPTNGPGGSSTSSQHLLILVSTFHEVTTRLGYLAKRRGGEQRYSEQKGEQMGNKNKVQGW